MRLSFNEIRARTALDVRLYAGEAAGKAAREAIEKSHAESLKAARSLSQAAGEARRQAWRYFGGFWVWLAVNRHPNGPPDRRPKVTPLARG